MKPQYLQRNVITKYAFATRVGYIPNNPNKINQDSFILHPNLSNQNFHHYFGVCDGHGQNGKDVSHFIKLRLPQYLQKQLQLTNGDIPKSLHNAFVNANADLAKCNFDVSLSGTTCCTVLFHGTKVICANAGDSRAIKVAITDTCKQLSLYLFLSFSLINPFY